MGGSQFTDVDRVGENEYVVGGGIMMASGELSSNKIKDGVLVRDAEEDNASGLWCMVQTTFGESEEWTKLYSRVLKCISSGAHRFCHTFIAPAELGGCVEIAFARGVYVCKVLAFENVTVCELSTAINAKETGPPHQQYKAGHMCAVVLSREARVELPTLGFPDLDPLEEYGNSQRKAATAPTSFGGRLYIFPPRSGLPDVPEDFFTVLMGRRANGDGIERLWVKMSPDGEFTPAFAGKAPKFGHASLLSAFASGAEVDDVNSLYLLSNHCKMYVCQANECTTWSTFAAAYDRYLACLPSVCTHRTVGYDANWFGVEAGEAHKSAGEAYEAIASYKLAANRAMAPGFLTPPHAQSFIWNCLGVALKRHGQLEMAARAYLWSLAVQGAEAAEYHKYAQHLTNVVSLLQMTPSQRELERKRDIEAIEIQRNTTITTVLREGKITTVLPCHHCKKKRDRASLKTCARCGVTRYCNRACQQADWSAHKKSCKKGTTEAADAAEAEVTA